MNTNTKKQSKTLAVVTYCIALVGILLALYLPFFNGNTMMALIVPQIFGNVFDINIEFGEAVPAILDFSVAVGNLTLPLGELAILVLAVIAVLGLIFLIPMAASKKESKTARALAYIVELVAIIALGVIAFCIIKNSAELVDGILNNIVVFAALACAFLMLLIQCFGYKKGSGVIKFILLILSVAAVVCAYSIGNIVTLNLPIEIPVTFVEINGTAYTALELIGASIDLTVIYIAGIATVAIALLNILLDFFSLATSSNKFSKIFNIIRYGLATVAVAVTLIFALISSEANVGLDLYAMLIIFVIQLVISIIRLATSKKKNIESVENIENAEVEPEYVEIEAEESEPVYAPAPVVEEVVPAMNYHDNSFAEPAHAYAQPVVQPVQNRSVIYKVTNIYNGPTDAFIETLTEDEKIEFSKMFIEKTKGRFPEVPNYEIDGDNKEFFSSIFIYLGKFRSLLSDGLMSKIFNQVGKN